MQRAPNRLVRFDAYEADLTARELSKRGRRLKLQDQPFQVLAALLEKPGEVVTREDLQQRIWGDDTFVDFDKSLSAAVNKVRQALDDSRTRPRYIETVPKVGYRFIGAIRLESGPIAPPPASDPVGRAGRLWAVGALVLAIVVWLGFSLANGSRPASTLQAVPAPVQLTSYPGEERQPTFSPDGNQVAFTRREPDRDDYDIWVKFVGQEDALQLTAGPTDEMSPAWSPDGLRIAFLRHRPDGVADLVLISPHGGTEITLTTIQSRANIPSTLAWSPAGDRLITYQRPDSGVEVGLFAISVDSGAKDRLLDANARTPSYSPDGETIAFLLGTSQPDLAVMPSKGGSVRKLGHSVRNPGRAPIAWTPDGKGLVEGRPLSIYPLSGERPVPLPGVGGNAIEPAVSAAAGRLAHSLRVSSASTWLLDSQAPTASPQEFAPTSRSNANPQFSNDARQVVFTSNRSGELGIWVANRDGTNLRRLTDIPVGGTPRWSPDEAEIAFDGPREGSPEIYAVPPFPGSPRLITKSPAIDVVPSYSNDGRWVYFASNRSGDWQIWRVSVVGEEKRPESLRQMTRDGGYAAFESPIDDGYLYYSKRRVLQVGAANSLRRMPLDGGPEEVVIEGLYSSWSNWALAGDFVYFLNPADEAEKPEDASEWAIYKMHLRTRARSLVAPINGKPWAGPSLDVSHDERWILYSTMNPAESDLMLVESFR